MQLQVKKYGRRFGRKLELPLASGLSFMTGQILAFFSIAATLAVGGMPIIFGQNLSAPRKETPILETPWVKIPGGDFVMGDSEGEPEETPRKKRISPFQLMRFEVTRSQFAVFSKLSGHRTDPENSGKGWVWTRHWTLVAGADWLHPRGPETTGPEKPFPGNHPVVQVSARDAARFCSFYGLRLPTAPEWEFSARGTDGRRYPWGNEPPRQGSGAQANFGTVSCCSPDAADGFRYTSPVGSFPRSASPFGVLDMAGNVWEWTSSPFPGKTGEVQLRGGGWGNNPYCLRASYLHGNPPDIGLDMVGFRCARDEVLPSSQ